MALSVGTAFIDILPNMSKFTPALTAGTKGLAGTVGRVGTGLTKGLTVPILAAGAASTKMALDFNKAFVQIQTLGGKTGQSMESLKSQVLDLAEATGEDPEGLANALYLVTSAGKDAAKNAIPILTAAAKGAAVGMGDVNEIAKVLTGTTNAYGAENLSAAQAMDVLTQATTDSSAEADALAGSIGPVIGVASQLGITFEEVAASLATAAIQSIPVDRAATSLRFLIASLSAPTQEAKEKLDQYGISMQQLQSMVAEKGLTGTLQTLADTFDLTSTRGQQAWQAVTGGARGAVVANTLVGEHAADAAAEVENLGDVAGVTQEKFELWGTTITGQNAKALGSLKAAAIRLGTDLIPIFQKIVEVVSRVVDAYNNLSPAAQDAVVKFGLIAAAAGPLLKIFGPLVGLVIRLGGALAGLGGVSLAGLIIPAAAIAGVALIPVALKQANDQAKQNTATFNAMGDALHQGGEEAQRVHEFTSQLLNAKVTGPGFAQDLVNKIGLGIGAQAIQKYRTELDMMVRSQDFANASTETWTKSLVKNSDLSFSQSESVSRMISSFDKLGGKLSESDRAWIETYAKAGDFEGLVDRLTPKLNELYKREFGIKFHTDTKGVQRFTKATQETRTKLAAAQSALQKYGGELNRSQRSALEAAVKEGRFGQALKIVQRAINRMNPGKAKKAHDDIAKSAQRADKYLEQLPKHMKAGAAELNGLERGAQGAGKTIDETGRKVDGLNKKMDQIPKEKETKVTADVTPAQQTISNFIAANNGRTISLRVLADMPGNAKGTKNWPGGFSLVGELGPEKVILPNATRMASGATSAIVGLHGPEIVNLPRGSDVIPHGGFAKGVKNFKGGRALVGERGPELVVLPGETEAHHVSALKEVNQRDIAGGADGGDDGPVEIFGELTLTPDGRAFVQGIIADNDAHAARIGRMSR